MNGADLKLHDDEIAEIRGELATIRSGLEAIIEALRAGVEQPEP